MFRGFRGKGVEVCLSLVAAEVDLDVSHLEVIRPRGGTFAALADLAKASQDVRLERGKFPFSHLPQLHAHLSVEELLAEGVLVIQLLVGDRSHFVEDEPNAADQEGIQDKQGFSALVPVSAGY